MLFLTAEGLRLYVIGAMWLNDVSKANLDAYMNAVAPYYVKGDSGDDKQ